MPAWTPEPAVVSAEIQALNGNLAAVAKKLGVARNTLRRYLDLHPEVAQTLTEARETMLDMAESSLYRRVLAGDAWAVCFFLKTQGRTRGYIERGETVNLKINLEALSVEQLERLAAGEHPSLVLSAASSPGQQGSATTDPLTIEGTSRPSLAAQASRGTDDQ